METGSKRQVVGFTWEKTRFINKTELNVRTADFTAQMSLNYLNGDFFPVKKNQDFIRAERQTENALIVS